MLASQYLSYICRIACLRVLSVTANQQPTKLNPSVRQADSLSRVAITKLLRTITACTTCSILMCITTHCIIIFVYLSLHFEGRSLPSFTGNWPIFLGQFLLGVCKYAFTFLWFLWCGYTTSIWGICLFFYYPSLLLSFIRIFVEAFYSFATEDF